MFGFVRSREAELDRKQFERAREVWREQLKKQDDTIEQAMFLHSPVPWNDHRLNQGRIWLCPECDKPFPCNTARTLVSHLGEPD